MGKSKEEDNLPTLDRGKEAMREADCSLLVSAAGREGETGDEAGSVTGCERGKDKGIKPRAVPQ